MVNTGDDSSGAEPLLGEEGSVEWTVDYNGEAASESSGSAWLPASFIVGMEIAERFAFTGISCNLITYLTGPLRQSTATAAVNVNVWNGTASLTPLLGAFIADSCLGRYQTIIYFSLVYISWQLHQEGTSPAHRHSELINLPDKTRRREAIPFLNKALGAAPDNNNQEGSLNNWNVCSVSQVNEAKAILQLVPIWCACLVYAVISAQPSTFFTKQGSTLDRKIGSNFQIPAASLQVFISISIVFVMPAYDRVFVPIARVFTGKPRGITPLQRIGWGMSFSTTSMMFAAIIERKRLETTTTIPMSVWWLVPQYVSYGVSYAFTMVGLQEFFYDQVPDGLESVGMALYMSIFGIGNFLSGFLVSIINMVTSANGQDSWVSSNLNDGHLDYFYWLLVGLNIAAMTAFICLAKLYIYN
ncbi:hypothetical protein Scep_002880 [Stephania cephalantha]|uniref:Peptide transporter n=1 Tax=Stephania cephalantha TaxID=152367 RepID=A0AAP0LG03_9MAGN